MTADDDPDWVSAQSVAAAADEKEVLLQLRMRDYGQIVAMAHDDGSWSVEAGYRPRLDDDDIALFRAWVTERVYGLLKNGPVPGRWFRRSDGGWQVTMVARSDAEMRSRGLLTVTDIAPDGIPTDWT